VVPPSDVGVQQSRAGEVVACSYQGPEDDTVVVVNATETRDLVLRASAALRTKPSKGARGSSKWSSFTIRALKLHPDAGSMMPEATTLNAEAPTGW
jgi:hypothetical protein